MTRLSYCIMPSAALDVARFAMRVVDIYAMSLLMTNNELSRNDRSWIIVKMCFGLLSTYTILTFIPFFSTLFSYETPMISDSEKWYISSTYIMALDGGLTYWGPSKITGYFARLILMIANYHFACCAAFSGNYNNAAEVKWTPLNKYFAGVTVASFIAALITGLIYFFVYS